MGILQIRDVDDDDLDVLKARAERSGLSLSAYVRDLLHVAASRPTMAEVINDIAAEDPVDVSDAEIVGLIEAGRPA